MELKWLKFYVLLIYVRNCKLWISHDSWIDVSCVSLMMDMVSTFHLQLTLTVYTWYYCMSNEYHFWNISIPHLIKQKKKMHFKSFIYILNHHINDVEVTFSSPFYIHPIKMIRVHAIHVIFNFINLSFQLLYVSWEG